MTDCLLIGYNDYDFEKYVNMVRFAGVDSGAYRDLNLTFVELDGVPARSIDILNHFHRGKNGDTSPPFSNIDFMWPVILHLGTYLHRRGFSFDYVNLFHLEKDKLKEKLLDGNVLTVAITTTLYVAVNPILEIMSFIMAILPSGVVSSARDISRER